MNPEFLVALISGLLSAIAGRSGIDRPCPQTAFPTDDRKGTPQKTYSERLSELTSSLTKASSEVDGVLHEMAQVAKKEKHRSRNSKRG